MHSHAWRKGQPCRAAHLALSGMLTRSQSGLARNKLSRGTEDLEDAGFLALLESASRANVQHASNTARAWTDAMALCMVKTQLRPADGVERATQHCEIKLQKSIVAPLKAGSRPSRPSHLCRGSACVSRSI